MPKDSAHQNSLTVGKDMRTKCRTSSTNSHIQSNNTCRIRCTWAIWTLEALRAHFEMHRERTSPPGISSRSFNPSFQTSYSGIVHDTVLLDFVVHVLMPDVCHRQRDELYAAGFVIVKAELARPG